MVLSEATRHHLYRRLEAVLGPEDAATLMEHLPPVGWAEVATRRDLDVLRTDMAHLHTSLHADMAQLGASLHADMAQLDTALHADMAQLDTALHADMAQLDANIHADMTRLELRLEREMRLMTWRLVAVMVAVGSMIIAGIRL